MKKISFNKEKYTTIKRLKQAFGISNTLALEKCTNEKNKVKPCYYDIFNGQNPYTFEDLMLLLEKEMLELKYAFEHGSSDKKEFHEHLRDEAVDVHSFAAFIIAKATEELNKIK